MVKLIMVNVNALPFATKIMQGAVGLSAATTTYSLLSFLPEGKYFWNDQSTEARAFCTGAHCMLNVFLLRKPIININATSFFNGLLAPITIKNVLGIELWSFLGGDKIQDAVNNISTNFLGTLALSAESVVFTILDTLELSTKPIVFTIDLDERGSVENQEDKKIVKFSFEKLNSVYVQMPIHTQSLVPESLFNITVHNKDKQELSLQYKILSRTVFSKPIVVDDLSSQEESHYFNSKQKVMVNLVSKTDTTKWSTNFHKSHGPLSHCLKLTFDNEYAMCMLEKVEIRNQNKQNITIQDFFNGVGLLSNDEESLKIQKNLEKVVLTMMDGLSDQDPHSQDAYLTGHVAEVECVK